MRVETRRCLDEAKRLHEEAREMIATAEFWESLEDHQHDSGDCCEQPLCLQAWQMYPNG